MKCELIILTYHHLKLLMYKHFDESSYTQKYSIVSLSLMIKVYSKLDINSAVVSY